MTKLRLLVLAMFASLALVPVANSQTLTGSIDGTVVDSSGASIPGATVTMTNDVSKAVRTFTTEQNGSFVFPDLNTGNYSLHIEKTGFKAFDEKGMVLASGENLPLHELKLEVGNTETSVSVEANAARIQTDSADRFTTVEAQAVQEVPNPQRFFLAATRSMPGATEISSSSSNGNGAGTVDGGQGSANVVLQLDGVVQQDSGAPSSGVTTAGRFLVNNDAVNEVQVQVNVMNAEFGDRAGGQVTVTTKNGTNQFHGTLYTYLRNEDFNANTFFNNKTGVVRPKSRYQNPGGTFSGPVLLPWLPFNRQRNKMYFFYAEDWLANKTQATQSYTMPTTLEQTGNFSNTTTTSGALIPIYQPGTQTAALPNGVQYTGNIIPASQLNPEGQAFMSLFPSGCSWNSGIARGTMMPANQFGYAMPCIIDPTGNKGYNTQIYPVTNIPQTTRTLRVDYNITQKTIMYVRLLQSLFNTEGVNAGQTYGGTAWGQFQNTNPQNGRGDVVNIIHTFSPTLITDFTIGANFVHQQNQPENLTAFNADSLLSNFKYPTTGSAAVTGPLGGTLVNPTQIFSGNYLNLIPNVNLSTLNPQVNGQGYVSGTPAYGFDTRWPFDGTELTDNYTNNWTNIRGKHTFKAGFNLEHGARNVSVYENEEINGSYYFGSDTGNPNNSGYPVSNMLLGQIQEYGQDNQKQVNHARFYQYEWYIQDTFKASRRLTLDYGIRFQVIPQIYSAGATLGLFNASTFNANQAGVVLQPFCSVALPGSGTCPTADVEAVNPKSKAIYPGVDINHFDPASWTSTPYSGIQEFNGHIFKTQPPQLGPRFGFAYDVFGNGKTSIRGGFGIFYNREYSVDTIAASGGLTGPIKVYPQFQSPTFFNQTFSSLSTAQGLLGPQTFLADADGGLTMKNPDVMTYSLGIQHDLGKGLVIEVSYVGNNLHHGATTAFNYNGIYPDTVWSPTGGTCNAVGNCTGSLNPAYVNPTQTSQVLNINLLRALPGELYPGIADITAFQQTGTSNYNSMQEQLNKRFGKSIRLSSNWTWQKTIALSPNQYMADENDLKSVSGRKQAVNIQLNYSVPTLTKFIGKNVFTEGVFDGWKIDGVLSYFSGDPLGVSCSIASGAPAGAFNGQDGVGSGIPSRCAMNGNVFLPAGTGPSTANGNAATTDPKLWYPVDLASFSIPALGTNGFGNAPPTLFWGPSYENEDVSVYKAFTLKKENQQLVLRADITNVRNHFNPGDPNTSITYNYTNNTNTNASFGQVTGQTGTPRSMALSLRFRF